METIGSLIDRLITVDTKMWVAQEDFYHIRHMTFEQFLEKYSKEEGMRLLWKQFQLGIDLNIQRNSLIDEIDKTIAELTGREDAVQLKHKTY